MPAERKEAFERAAAAHGARGPWHPATAWAPLAGTSLVLLESFP